MKKSLAMIATMIFLQGCTGAQMKANAIMSQATQIVEKAKACAHPLANKDVYAPLRYHTNLEDVRKASYDNLTDRSYISREESVLAKQLIREQEPCKKEAFSSFINMFPDIALAIVNADTEGMRITSRLIQRQITWGEYNQQRIKSIENANAAMRPYFNRLDAELTAEHNREVAVRQQIFNAMTAYAQAVNAVNAANYANRPVLTTCRNMGGFTSCVSN